jgi:hypothetical protein
LRENKQRFFFYKERYTTLIQFKETDLQIMWKLYSSIIDKVPLKEAFELSKISNINLFLKLKVQSISIQIEKLISQGMTSLPLLNENEDCSVEKLAH